MGITFSGSESGTFSTRDGLKLFYQIHVPQGASRLMIVLHGHGEHIGRYEKFKENLKDANIALAMYDARGYGRSEGSRVYVDSFEEYLDDITAFRSFLAERLGFNDKIILFGHSMGGLAALHWVLRNSGKDIESLILSSPCLGLRLPAALIRLNAVLNRLHPKMIYQNPVYPPYLTHNQQEVEKYRKDPLIQRKISVRLLAEMIRYSLKLKDQSVYRFPFPVYILMAGLERVVDRSRTEEIYQQIQAPKKFLKCFEGFYHEIFNELEQEKVFEILRTCLHDSLVPHSQTGSPEA